MTGIGSFAPINVLWGSESGMKTLAGVKNSAFSLVVWGDWFYSVWQEINQKFLLFLYRCWIIHGLDPRWLSINKRSFILIKLFGSSLHHIERKSHQKSMAGLWRFTQPHLMRWLFQLSGFIVLFSFSRNYPYISCKQILVIMHIVSAILLEMCCKTTVVFLFSLTCKYWYCFCFRT